MKGDTEMPENKRIRPTASVAPPTPPLLVPQLPLAPLLPPAHVVDLMTSEGSAVFGAQWKAMEAKIVECPALTDSMPEFKTTYDVEPYAGERVLSPRRCFSPAGTRESRSREVLRLMPCFREATIHMADAVSSRRRRQR